MTGFLRAMLPFAFVLGVVWGGTVALFDVPAALPAKAEVLSAPPRAHPTTDGDERLNEVVSRALRALDGAAAERPATAPRGPETEPPRAPEPAPSAASAGRAGLPAPPTTPAAVAERSLPVARRPASDAPPAEQPGPSQTNLLGAMSALKDVIQISRDARSDADLARAEESMRRARVQMEAACTGAGGPLCDSAREIRDMGY